MLRGVFLERCHCSVDFSSSGGRQGESDRCRWQNHERSRAHQEKAARIRAEVMMEGEVQGEVQGEVHRYPSTHTVIVQMDTKDKETPVEEQEEVVESETHDNEAELHVEEQAEVEACDFKVFSSGIVISHATAPVVRFS